ncbi:hypothetical protein [Parasphingorhabdus sp.]
MIAKSECKGDATATTEEGIIKAGDACGGASQLIACSGPGADMCCAQGFKRSLCRCENCNGPWIKKSKPNDLKKVYENKKKEKCFCLDAKGTYGPINQTYNPACSTWLHGCDYRFECLQTREVLTMERMTMEKTRRKSLVKALGAPRRALATILAKTIPTKLVKDLATIRAKMIPAKLVKDLGMIQPRLVKGLVVTLGMTLAKTILETLVKGLATIRAKTIPTKPVKVLADDSGKDDVVLEGTTTEGGTATGAGRAKFNFVDSCCLFAQLLKGMRSFHRGFR